MVISHSAISCRGLLPGLLLICIMAFSADARSAGKVYAGSYQDSVWRSDFQDNKPEKDKKAADPETKKPDVQQVDRGKQDPQKPEIKEVPKARKQLKPAAVKPKVKPVKINRPKIKKH
jgi:hypothetical protein